jgi:dihydroorotase
MSKMMALGMDLGFVVRAATQHPAEILRMGDEIGSLKPGSRADISVLEQVQEPWTFRDRLGGSQVGKSRLIPRLVVRKGKAIVPTNRLLRDVVQVRDLLPA